MTQYMDGPRITKAKHKNSIRHFFLNTTWYKTTKGNVSGESNVTYFCQEMSYFYPIKVLHHSGISVIFFNLEIEITLTACLSQNYVIR